MIDFQQLQTIDLQQLQQLVDRLDTYLRSTETEIPEPIRIDAVTYAKTVAGLNSWLRQCDVYLRQDLHAEAVHFVDTEPDIHEAVAISATIDQPLFAQLAMAINQPFESLSIEVADHLNSAYVKVQPLKDFLQQHRLLALAHRPIADRLTVMHRIRELDPTTPHWNEDTRELERARFEEMQAESRAASKSGSARTMQTLMEELETTPWLQPPPESLVLSIQRLHAETMQSAAKSQLAAVAEQLNQAFANRQLQPARQLLEKWNRIAHKSGAGANGAAAVQQAKRWIDESDRKARRRQAYQAAIGRLEQALEHAPTRGDLEQAMREVVAFNIEIPDDLRRKYDQRIERYEHAKRSERKMVYGILAIVLLIIVAIGGLAGMILFK